MKDFTIGGFVSACIFSGIAYFFTRSHSGLERYLIHYVVGLIAYFSYVAMMKHNHYDDHWKSMDIFTAFFSTGFAQWVPGLLILMFG